MYGYEESTDQGPFMGLAMEYGNLCGSPTIHPRNAGQWEIAFSDGTRVRTHPGGQAGWTHALHHALRVMYEYSGFLPNDPTGATLDILCHPRNADIMAQVRTAHVDGLKQMRRFVTATCLPDGVHAKDVDWTCVERAVRRSHLVVLRSTRVSGLARVVDGLVEQLDQAARQGDRLESARVARALTQAADALRADINALDDAAHSTDPTFKTSP